MFLASALVVPAEVLAQMDQTLVDVLMVGSAFLVVGFALWAIRLLVRAQ